MPRPRPGEALVGVGFEIVVVEVVVAADAVVFEAVTGGDLLLRTEAALAADVRATAVKMCGTRVLALGVVVVVVVALALNGDEATSASGELGSVDSSACVAFYSQCNDEHNKDTKK